MKLHHLALKVTDLNVCREFYSYLLGLTEKTTQQTSTGDLRSVWYDLGDGILFMLEQGEGEKGDSDLGWHLISLLITRDERLVWRRRLIDSGISIEAESPYSLFFRDPEGNRVALTHYPDGVEKSV